jgi:pterin-4a-carbinolamine dehydratase
MKGIIRYFLFGLFVLCAFTACSKQPVQEINAARSAVDSAMAEGAEKYSPAEAMKVNDALTAAIAEVKIQDSKFFKDYKKSREMLAQVKADADDLRAGLTAKKEETKKKAISAEESANASVSKAKASLAKAMKSTRAELDLETMSSTIRGLDDSLAEIKKLINTEDYTTAIEKADAVKEKAASMSIDAGFGEVSEKTPGKKETKKKK